MKDPDGANLARIQIIKGWLDADGESREAVFEVKWAGDRTPEPEWQATACGRYGVEMDDEVPLVHQERAFSSPIWRTL